MFGFEASIDAEKKLLPPPELAEPPKEKESAQPAVTQSIAEIQKAYPAGGANGVETPEAKAAAGAGPTSVSTQALGDHGPAAHVAPLAQSVAEIKQSVAETQNAAPPA
ncbi:MAG TPA: hypothetical protein VHE35_03725, partial [Kofleriaceae bacterium]|nr:hypothetical protein [Kofleriaceae bacterium]